MYQRDVDVVIACFITIAVFCTGKKSAGNKNDNANKYRVAVYKPHGTNALLFISFHRYVIVPVVTRSAGVVVTCQQANGKFCIVICPFNIPKRNAVFRPAGIYRNGTCGKAIVDKVGTINRVINIVHRRSVA